MAAKSVLLSPWRWCRFSLVHRGMYGWFVEFNKVPCSIVVHIRVGPRITPSKTGTYVDYPHYLDNLRFSKLLNKRYQRNCVPARVAKQKSSRRLSSVFVSTVDGGLLFMIILFTTWHSSPRIPRPEISASEGAKESGNITAKRLLDDIYNAILDVSTDLNKLEL